MREFFGFPDYVKLGKPLFYAAGLLAGSVFPSSAGRCWSSGGMHECACGEVVVFHDEDLVVFPDDGHDVSDALYQGLGIVVCERERVVLLADGIESGLDRVVHVFVLLVYVAELRLSDAVRSLLYVRRLPLYVNCWPLAVCWPATSWVLLRAEILALRLTMFSFTPFGSRPHNRKSFWFSS